MAPISLEDLDRKLQGLPQRIRGRPLARAARRAMAPVRSAVRASVRRKRGDLKRAVRTKVKRMRRGEGVIATVGFGRKGSHANLLELGTKNADGSVRIAADHHVRDVFRAHEQRVEKDFSKELLNAIAQELKRL